MAEPANAFVDDVLGSNKAVLTAAAGLKRAIESSDPARVQFAVRDLEQAASLREIDSETGGFRFATRPASADLSGTPAGPAPIPETLVAVLSDLQTANVLMAAGTLTGEVEAPGTPQLNAAVADLEITTQSSTVRVQGAAGFGFAGETLPEPSPDVPSALTQFQARCEEALKMLVEQVRGVLNSIIEKLSGLDKDKVLDALNRIGQSAGLPNFGRLYQKAIDIIGRALETLRSLLGEGAVTFVREKATAFWNGLTSGKLIEDLLAHLFDVSGVKQRIAAIAARQDLEIAPLDTASGDLAGLEEKLKRTMSTLGAIATAIGTAAALLALAPISGQTLAVITAGAYVLVLAAAVVIGMDYADSEKVVQRVRGIGGIVSSVAKP
ncbi:MAG TPA: hypothetical protein VFQ79_18885 [Bryobacteraceae bacterium]|nr:hypothetical protein [Bryobacteraceae bacterium]